MSWFDNGEIVFSQATVLLEISAVADSIPEEMEVFHVQLVQPVGGATLGSVTRKTVIIERNDAPYGLLEIFTLNKYCLKLKHLHSCLLFLLLKFMFRSFFI